MASKFSWLTLTVIICMVAIGSTSDSSEESTTGSSSTASTASSVQTTSTTSPTTTSSTSTTSPTTSPTTTTSPTSTATTTTSSVATTSPTTTTTTATSSVPTTAAPDCPWGDWQSWSKCNCRTGSQMRIRNPKYLPGKYCTATGCNGDCALRGCAGETRTCTRSKCPIDCVYSKWSSWSECNGPCGDTIRRRYRRVRVPALYGGKKCTRFMEETRCQLYDPQCAPADCEVSNWSAWSACEYSTPYNTCGECIYGTEFATTATGIQVRERVIVNPGGHHCPHLQETKTCYMSCC